MTSLNYKSSVAEVEEDLGPGKGQKEEQPFAACMQQQATAPSQNASKINLNKSYETSSNNNNNFGG